MEISLLGLPWAPASLRERSWVNGAGNDSDLGYIVFKCITLIGRRFFLGGGLKIVEKHNDHWTTSQR